MIDTAASFSADYQEARSKFLKAASNAGGVIESITHPECGPDGQALFTDVASFGLAQAENVLVLISGTHGVEGFCGSGAQIDLLQREEIGRLAPNVGILMIHAINPYGFAWLRRVTHENIDLNRNWIDFGNPLPQNTAYAELDPWICPQRWDATAQKASADAMTKYTADHGQAAMLQAISGGQHDYPNGLFFGGTAPSWSQITQISIFKHYLSEASKVGVIDYHTGLGPWGFGEQIIVAPKVSSHFQRAAKWYGSAVAPLVDGASSSAKIAGDGLSAVAGLLPSAEVTCMALEVGTLPTNQILNALQADCWLHAYGDPLADEATLIKRQIRQAFYGDRDDWKGMVAAQSLLAVRQAIAGLSN